MSEKTVTEEKPEIIGKKSEDKREIEDEERKMIGGGEEISRTEVEKKKKALEEAAEGAARRRAPTGGIRVPGFLRVSRSRDKNKEDDEDGEEGADLLPQPAPDTKSPVEPNQPQSQQQASQNKPILSKLNLTVPFIKKKKENEDGVGTQAGLASMETLDDSNGSKADEKQLELIRLEHDLDLEKQALEDEANSKWSKKDWKRFWKFIKEYRFAVGGITLFVVLLIILLFYIAFGPKSAPHAPIIDGKYVNAVTSCGLVEGLSENGIFVFRGIPYAKPPVGPLRFAPPHPLTLNECWNSTFKAHNVTPSCWQMFANGSIDGTEDCLTIDIFTPHVRYDSPLPVVVAIGLEELAIQPTIVRSRDVVLIIPKIRQGPLGFTSSHQLTQATYPKSSGNYGLADLIAALKWVKLNAEHFGGDVNEITVLAWRQAATLATVLTTIHKPKNYFARLWISSGSAIFPNQTLQESEKESEEYIRGLPCPNAPSANCLRTLDVEDLLDAVPDSWRPIARGSLPGKEQKRHSWLVQDGNIIREYLYNVWERQSEDKDFQPIPVVIGTTVHSEVSREWKEAHAGYTEDDVRKVIENSLIGKMNYTDKVLALYNSTVAGLAEIVSDIATVCPLYFLHQKIPGAKFYLLKQTAASDDLVYGGSDISSVLGWAPSPRVTIRRSSTVLQHMFNQFVSLGVLPRYKTTAITQDEEQMRDGLPRCQLWKNAGLLDYAWVD
ncbi:neurotactin isoform X2 [Halyomorpha halys]|uniref:neurotactin isoform X2 n=1 Tax=Halyomorpha halys TaxID=286706 RepID=UPI0034D34D39